MLLLAVFTTKAQQDSTLKSNDIIVMHEDDLVALIKRLKEYKRNNVSKDSTIVAINSFKKAVLKQDSLTSKKVVLEKQMVTLQPTSIEKKVKETAVVTVKNNTEPTEEVIYLRKQIVILENIIKDFNSQNTVAKTNAVSNTDALNKKELESIKNDISQIKSAINQLANQKNKDIKVIVPKAKNETITKIVPVTTIIKEKTIVDTKETLALSNKIDSLNVLFTNLKAQKENPDYTKQFSALENTIAQLQKELTQKNEALSNYDVLVNEFKEYSKIIYFANNAINLNADGNLVVNELKELLAKNDKVDILVKGFASNKGNALYNENLSMLRTESVKKALILKNIHPTRVLTQYHGIDYKATSNEARRVEITILVRK